MVIIILDIKDGWRDSPAERSSRRASSVRSGSVDQNYTSRFLTTNPVPGCYKGKTNRQTYPITKLLAFSVRPAKHLYPTHAAPNIMQTRLVPCIHDVKVSQDNPEHNDPRQVASPMNRLSSVEIPKAESPRDLPQVACLAGAYLRRTRRPHSPPIRRGGHGSDTIGPWGLSDYEKNRAQFGQLQQL